MGEDQKQGGAGEQPAPVAVTVPTPVPLPVTGVERGSWRPPAGRPASRTRIAVTIAVAVGAVLLVVSAIASFLLVVVPLRAHSDAMAALRARVVRDYPGYTIDSVLEMTQAEESPAGGRDTVEYFTLRNIRSPGFVYIAAYSAPEKSADDPATYENLDDFFRMGVPIEEPVDSFIDAWLRAHPGQDVDYVTEVGGSNDPTRTYEVDYSLSVRTGQGVTTSQDTYHYGYVTMTGVWTQIEQPPVVPAVVYEDEASLENTAATVHEWLPQFKIVENVTDAQGHPMVIVRHRSYPGLQMVVYPDLLDPELGSDGMVQLFSGPHARADAFAKLWSSRHPTAIVSTIEFDPDFEKDAGLLEVVYAKKRSLLDDINAIEWLRFRYRPKTHTWVSAPVPPE